VNDLSNRSFKLINLWETEEEGLKADFSIFYMMYLLFCDKCGSILKIKIEEGRYFGVCGCGCIKEVASGIFGSGIMKKKEEKGEGVLQEDVSRGFPHVCKKCDYGECEISDLGCAYSDESNIYLYKCKKCGFVERQADGTGNL